MKERLLSDQERFDWLRLSRSENVGPKAFGNLVKLYGSVSKALDKISELSVRGGKNKPITLYSKAATEREMERHAAIGARIIAACEPEFSDLLRGIKDCPPVLSVLGDATLWKQKTVAIVGARNASANGCVMAERLAKGLSEKGVVCVSGLARGVDTAVHVNSLKHGTIAVIAGGIDHIYPKENAGLYRAIAEQGLIVAESPLGAAPKSSCFPRRNRIISGLSYGVVVVEASMKSGSLITAEYALEQDRDVCAVPGSPLDPRARGTNDLIRQGAFFTETAEDVIAGVHFMNDDRPYALEEPEGYDYSYAIQHEHEDALLNRERPRILAKLGPSPVCVDIIIKQLCIPAAVATIVLLELDLAGRLNWHLGNRVSLRYPSQEDEDQYQVA